MVFDGRPGVTGRFPDAEAALEAHDREIFGDPDVGNASDPDALSLLYGEEPVKLNVKIPDDLRGWVL